MGIPLCSVELLTAVAGFDRIISTLRFHEFFWFFPQSKK